MLEHQWTEYGVLLLGGAVASSSSREQSVSYGSQPRPTLCRDITVRRTEGQWHYLIGPWRPG